MSLNVLEYNTKDINETHLAMTTEEATHVYDILQDICGAPDGWRDLFIHRFTEPDKYGMQSEFRFFGKLMFGGKFNIKNKKWHVNCYPEDETPERMNMIEEANKLINVFYQSYLMRHISEGSVNDDNDRVVELCI